MVRDIPDTGIDARGLSRARLVIDAVVLGKRPAREVAAAYGVSRSWIYDLVARYRSEGETAFDARSRRPLERVRLFV
jgi:transposase